MPGNYGGKRMAGNGWRERDAGKLWRETDGGKGMPGTYFYNVYKNKNISAYRRPTGHLSVVGRPEEGKMGGRMSRSVRGWRVQRGNERESNSSDERKKKPGGWPYPGPVGLAEADRPLVGLLEADRHPSAHRRPTGPPSAHWRPTGPPSAHWRPTGCYF
jgi:hypothetical protein